MFNLSEEYRSWCQTIWSFEIRNGE